MDSLTPYTLYHGDCLDILGTVTDNSVDMVLCDLPYGVLNKDNPHTKWDSTVDLNTLWKHYRRVCRKGAAIVLFAQGMFTSRLMMSAPKLWRYNLIWNKDRCTGFLNAARMPLRCHEDICVFYDRLPIYNPQMEELNGREPTHPQGYGKGKLANRCYGNLHSIDQYTPKHYDKKFPRSILRFPKEHDRWQIHPTQKPVDLLRYLIRTYTNEGMTVLDNCMGSGATGVAAAKEKRNFIGIEIDDTYFAKASIRINDAYSCNYLF